MLCPNCKKEIPDGTQFCPECGASVNSNEKPAKAKKTITKKWWFWVIIVVVVIALIGAVGGDDDTDAPVNSDNDAVVEQNELETTTEQTTETTETTTEATLSEEEYKASCEIIPYKDIARLPDNYLDKNVMFTDEVIQVMESSWTNSVTYRINVTKDEYGYWDDTVYVTYELPEGAPRILEDDIVKFYGICKGTYTYESVLGSSVTIPSVEALFIDIQ